MPKLLSCTSSLSSLDQFLSRQLLIFVLIDLFERVLSNDIAYFGSYNDNHLHLDQIVS